MVEVRVITEAKKAKQSLCFMLHLWSKWEDQGEWEKSSTIHKGLIGKGVEQRRRCLNCNKLQIRIEWLTDP